MLRTALAFLDPTASSAVFTSAAATCSSFSAGAFPTESLGYSRIEGAPVTSLIFKLSALAIVGIGMTISAPSPSLAQSEVLSARESDPQVMGWMKGFPPPKDKIITQPDSVYFSFPRLRWSVCHMRELLPTEEVSRGLAAPISSHTAILTKRCETSSRSTCQC